MTKILLVEDDKGLREIYSVRLLAEGYTLISSGDGEEALAAAIGEKPDLIISDIMMPKISGFEMLDLLRSNESTKNIPVIMLTALSSEQQRERGTRLGADRYLIKSQVGIEDIVRTVHEVLGDSKQNKNIEQLQDSLALNSPLSTTKAIDNVEQTENGDSHEPSDDEINAYTKELNSPTQPNPELIAGNPSIIGTNFGITTSLTTQTPDELGTPTVVADDNNNQAKDAAAPQPLASEHANDTKQAAMTMQNALNRVAPSKNQSAFNPPAATEPSRVAKVTAPELPDRPMSIPAKMDTQPADSLTDQHSAVRTTHSQAFEQSPFQPAQQPAPQPLQRPAEQAQQFAVPPAESPETPKPIQQTGPAPMTSNPMFDHSGAQSVNGSDDEPTTQPQSSTGQLSGRGGERIITPPADGSSQGPRINIDELLASASANESNSMFPTTGQ